MKFSSGGTLLITNNFFGKSDTSPLCREYTVSFTENSARFKIICFMLIGSCLIQGVILNDDSTNYSSYILFSILCLSLIYCLYYTVEKESLLLVVPLTLQMTTTYILGNESTFSLPWSAIGDFMIMEVIMGQKVHYFLSLVLRRNIDGKGREDHIILFKNIKPPLKCLEVVYRDVQKIVDKSR